jgi:hypothetical protein
MFGVVPYPNKTPAGESVNYPNVFPGTPTLESFYKGFITELLTLQPGTLPAQPTIRPESIALKIQQNTRYMSSVVGTTKPVWFSEFMGRQAARWFALQWFYAFGAVSVTGVKNTRVSTLPVANETALISSQGSFASQEAIRSGLTSSEAIVAAITSLADKLIADVKADESNNTKRAANGKEFYGKSAGLMYRIFLGEYIGNVSPSDQIIRGQESSSPSSGSATPGAGVSSDNAACGCEGKENPEGNSNVMKYVLLAGAAFGGWYWYRKSKGLPLF